MKRRGSSADQQSGSGDGTAGSAAWGGSDRSGYSGSGYGPPGYAGPPGFRPEDVEPAGTLKKARTGLIVLTAFLVELVLIAAGANQSVSKHTADYAGRHGTTLLGNAARASLVYAWRFSAPAGDNRGGVHIWWSELATVGTVLVLTLLLTAVLVRGPVTFPRAFFGIWLAVIVATGIARVVALLVTRYNVAGERTPRYVVAIFAGPDGYAFAAGVGLGFVTALIASIVAVSSRRALPLAVAPDPVEAPLPPAPEAPPPYYGNAPEAQRPAPAQDERATTSFPSFAKRPHEDESGTTAPFPQARDERARDERARDERAQDERAQDEQGRTTQVPRDSGISGSTPAERPAGADDSTRAFPLPPDDEDLGHHDDH